ncbi:MAG: Fic family protein [Humibacillus sp.]|nr:Fic family protein [Humibacillus sp.]MDN5780152.1 Fic family protein [Humibacillus sp.]
MPDRSLFYAATPEAAYLIVRDQSLPNQPDAATGEADMVELVARRGGCPGGTTVAVTAAEQDLRPGRPGAFLIPRAKVIPAAIGRAFQPWHADVEPDKHQRWKAYLQPGSITLRNLVGADTPGTLRTREDDRVTAQIIALAEQPVAASFDLNHLREIHRRLFQDVYPWAGETRTVQIGRPGGPGFFDWEAIAEGYGEILERLEGSNHLRGVSRDEFTEEATQVYNAVNTVHAFREGNGRTQREWMNDLARGAGYELDWTRVHGFTNDIASQRAREGDLTQLRRVLGTITTTRAEPQTAPSARPQGDGIRRVQSRARPQRPASRDGFRPAPPRTSGPTQSH